MLQLPGEQPAVFWFTDGQTDDIPLAYGTDISHAYTIQTLYFGACLNPATVGE